jgi:hypothetical protein
MGVFEGGGLSSAEVNKLCLEGCVVSKQLLTCFLPKGCLLIKCVPPKTFRLFCAIYQFKSGGNVTVEGLARVLAGENSLCRIGGGG